MFSNVTSLVVAVAPLASRLIELIERQKRPGVFSDEYDGFNNKVNLFIRVEEW